MPSFIVKQVPVEEQQARLYHQVNKTSCKRSRRPRIPAKHQQMRAFATPASPQSNFSFLEQGDPLLAQLGASAERYCLPDPNACLLKLRQFGEAVAQHLAAVGQVA